MYVNVVVEKLKVVQNVVVLDKYLIYIKQHLVLFKLLLLVHLVMVMVKQ